MLFCPYSLSFYGLFGIVRVYNHIPAEEEANLFVTIWVLSVTPLQMYWILFWLMALETVQKLFHVENKIMVLKYYWHG